MNAEEVRFTRTDVIQIKDANLSKLLVRAAELVKTEINFRSFDLCADIVISHDGDQGMWYMTFYF